MTQRTDWGAWNIKTMEIKIMDYEEYKRKALEPIVSYIESVMVSYSKEELEDLIRKALPEKESEDERIRMEIIDWMKGGSTYDWQENKEKWIAYLEKQKEQKPAKWEWPNLSNCIRNCKKCHGKCFYRKEPYEEQKPTEWSDIDELKLQTIEAVITQQKGSAIFGGFLPEELIDFLKSLRPQPSGNLAISFMNYLDEHRPDGKMCLSNGECADIETAFKKEDWAKVIRYVNKYQPHWKPSVEQVSILGKVFAGCELNTSERDSMVDLFYHLKDMI